MHCYVFIEYVIYDSITIFPRICLYIYAFERLLKISISEGNVSYTIGLRMRRYTTDRQSYSKPHCNILNENVLSTVSKVVRILVSWFGNNNIIVVLTGNVEDMQISALRVYAISVEWKEWNYAI